MVEILEQRDEFATAMPALDAGRDTALVQIQRRQKGTGSLRPVAAQENNLAAPLNRQSYRRAKRDILECCLFR